MPRTFRAFFFATAATLAGCGGPQETLAVVSSPFTSEHAAVFEDGLDLVRDPRVLEGQWLTSWEDELDQRVSLADVVVLVTVRTLRTDVDLDRRRTFRLVSHVDRVLLGEHVGEEIVLTVREGEGGFGTGETNERSLLDAQDVAFVKWAEDEDGTVRARWHLSPATDQVAGRTRALLLRRRDVADESGSHRRIIINRN